MDQKQIIQLQIMEQEANQLNQQLQLIEQNLSEIKGLQRSLDELEKTEQKEILSNIGKGIYIPVEIKSKKLIVEVGNKNFVKKSIPETKKIIEEQVEKLDSVKQQINERIEALQIEMNRLMQAFEQESKGKNEKK